MSNLLRGNTMPYTKKEHKLWTALIKQYGEEKGKKIYYAMEHSSKHKNLFGSTTKERLKRKLRHSLKKRKLG